ncbi:MAG: methyltransferase domain-containing protein, partial [Dyadobacter sp.]
MRDNDANNPESWSAKQYSKFEKERNRPISDLLGHIENVKVNLAADLGCGPGNSTELLRNKYPDARIIGMDSSLDMVENARTRLPDLEFKVAD